MPILLEEDRLRPLPKLIKLQQEFPRSRVADVAAAVRSELARPCIREKLLPGARVAVAVGSRGIRNLRVLVETLLTELKSAGTNPFIVSAMGSHGGGTEAGQREVLAGYSITQEALGVPVVTTVDTTVLGKTAGGIAVHFDTAALGADLIIPVNRVKLHTDFVGNLQSGLCKMLVIGLGNHRGCSSIHEQQPERFAAILEEAAGIILDKAPVGFGLAVVENAYDETALVEAVPREALIAREKELVKLARVNMPTLNVPKIDVLIVEHIGKDISGAGFDPNILGKSSVLREFVLPVPIIQRMVLLGVTECSHGNGIGIGLFDVVTKAAAAGLDWEAMYANAIACKCIDDVKLPLVAEDEDEAVRVALKCCRNVDRKNPRIVKIKSTLDLEEIEVSPAVLQNRDPA